MSYQPWNQGGLPARPGQQLPAMRASHADRERAIDVLKAGFTEGRLSQAEYEQRLTSVQSAQTYAELHTLLADLPQGPVPLPTPMPQQYAAPVPRTFMPLAPPPQTNGSATAALVCGILTPITYGLTAIPAVILGHKARSEISRTGERGEGLATAGLVLGWLAIGFGLLMVMFVLGAAVLGR